MTPPSSPASNHHAPEPGTLLLRWLTPADLAAYKALRDSMLSRHEQAFSSDADSERARDAASYRSRLHAGAGGMALFTQGAWLNGRLVGAVTCEQERRIKSSHIVQLVGMFVADEHARQGIGRALLTRALSILTDLAMLEIVTLSVSSSNTAALALYRSVGFTRYGHLPRALRLGDGRYVGKDLMWLQLHESASRAHPDGTSIDP